MSETREAPGWAARPDATDTRRIVTCGGCGEAMPWSTFTHGHLRECGEQDPRTGEGATDRVGEDARCRS